MDNVLTAVWSTAEPGWKLSPSKEAVVACVAGGMTAWAIVGVLSGTGDATVPVGPSTSAVAVVLVEVPRGTLPMLASAGLESTAWA